MDFTILGKLRNHLGYFNWDIECLFFPFFTCALEERGEREKKGRRGELTGSSYPIIKEQFEVRRGQKMERIDHNHSRSGFRIEIFWLVGDASPFFCLGVEDARCFSCCEKGVKKGGRREGEGRGLPRRLIYSSALGAEEMRIIHGKAVDATPTFSKEGRVFHLFFFRSY